MNDSIVLVDRSIDYQVKEAGIVIVALFWVIGLGSVLIAAWILCGWRGAKQVTFDWIHLKATFYCR